MALTQGKIHRGEKLEPPPRFLPTGALLLGALDVLMTSQIGWRGKNNPKTKHRYIFNVLLWAPKCHCFSNTSQETPAKVGIYNALSESTASVKNWWVCAMEVFDKEHGIKDDGHKNNVESERHKIRPKEFEEEV